MAAAAVLALVTAVTASPPVTARPPAGGAFGITFVTDAGDRTPLAVGAAAAIESGSRVVVLVHGLDDPGWMWRDVIAALRGAGFAVARMRYPNDGPIAESADLFAFGLLDLRAAGISRIDVVAHSMGGLVARDVLTRRTLYAGDGAGNDRLPAVDRLILCGTPNAGSKLVRLRAISEVKEQITRVFTREGDWRGGLGDGAGEAAIDLEPGSEFLRRLNRRGPIAHTEITIIAGRMSPVGQEDLDRVSDAVRSAARSANAPEWLHRWIDNADETASDALRGAVHGLGDGCVTLDSARLDGVDDFVVVSANHVSMIVNVMPSDDETPPAIPIILDRLR
jgi:pimeloyl-ACP methyl ester carboxylesterase